MIKLKRKNESVYVVQNWEKYKGKQNPIIRSKWERMFAQWLDFNQNILQWSSESHAIPYYDPVRQKQRRYYPDFYMKIIDGNKKSSEWIVELKPKHETLPTKINKRKSLKTISTQKATYATNMAKFKAASEYCKKMNMKFKILTEDKLFRQV